MRSCNINASGSEKLYQAVVRLIKIRIRTEKEISSYLSEKTADKSLADGLLKRAKSGGLIDDRKFALLWLEDRRFRSPRSLEFVREELRAKGVPEDTINIAVEQSAITDKEMAALVVAQGRRKNAGLSGDRLRNKIFKLLVSRGFEADDAAEITDSADMGTGSR